MVDLQVVEFSAKYLPRVKDFDCGNEEWAIWAADWIKNAPPFTSALRSIRDYETQVWLYYVFVEVLDEEILVGFSSLGITNWRIPGPEDPKRTVGFIPMLAVARSFQGKSASSEGKRYSRLIMDDVISKAREHGRSELCLTVDPKNHRAIRFYEQAGFRQIEGPDTHGNLRMHKSLD